MRARSDRATGCRVLVRTPGVPPPRTRRSRRRLVRRPSASVTFRSLLRSLTTNDSRLPAANDDADSGCSSGIGSSVHALAVRRPDRRPVWRDVPPLTLLLALRRGRHRAISTIRQCREPESWGLRHRPTRSASFGACADRRDKLGGDYGLGEMLAMSSRAVRGEHDRLQLRLGGAEPAAAEGAAASSAMPSRSLWRWRPSRVAVAALLTGLIVTGALVLTSVAVYNRNERRLLNLRVRELSLVLAATAPSIQTPLASAAELAERHGRERAEVPCVHGSLCRSWPPVHLGIAVAVWEHRTLRRAPCSAALPCSRRCRKGPSSSSHIPPGPVC